MRFLPLDKLINLHDGYRRRIKIDQLDLLLIQEGGQVHIVHSRCPHREHSLEQADIDSGFIFCPLHGFGFSLKDGHHDGGLCESLKVYAPVFEGADVGIVIEAEV
jgi:nitrite reductase/ring-hydroxylating ferredoxin subunit